MKKSVQEDNIVYGLDFGSSSLKVAVCELLDIHDYEVLSTMTFPYMSAMIKKQFDKERIKHLVDRALNRIDRELPATFPSKKAIVTLPTAEYKSDVITVETVLKNNIVKYEHKINLINKAKEISSCGAILHTIPLKYTLDGESILDPVGLQGDTLTMDVSVIGYDEYLLEQFKSIFDDLSIKVGKYVAPPLSFINYYLNFVPNNHKSKDLLILDFGAEVSHCYRIINSQLSAYYSQSLGNEIIARDIKVVLDTSMDTAKKLNEKYVNLCSGSGDEINVDGTSVKLSLLNEIVEARYDEILEHFERLIPLNKDNAVDMSFVLLGDGHPEGSSEYLEKRWGGKCQSIKPFITDSEFIMSIGNIQYALNNEIYIPQLTNKASRGIITRLFQRFEDLF